MSVHLELNNCTEDTLLAPTLQQALQDQISGCNSEMQLAVRLSNSEGNIPLDIHSKLSRNFFPNWCYNLSLIIIIILIAFTAKSA